MNSLSIDEIQHIIIEDTQNIQTIEDQEDKKQESEEDQELETQNSKINYYINEDMNVNYNLSEKKNYKCLYCDEDFEYLHTFEICDDIIYLCDKCFYSKNINDYDQYYTTYFVNEHDSTESMEKSEESSKIDEIIELDMESIENIIHYVTLVTSKETKSDIPTSTPIPISTDTDKDTSIYIYPLYDNKCIGICPERISIIEFMNLIKNIPFDKIGSQSDVDQRISIHEIDKLFSLESNDMDIPFRFFCIGDHLKIWKFNNPYKNMKNELSIYSFRNCCTIDINKEYLNKLLETLQFANKNC